MKFEQKEKTVAVHAAMNAARHSSELGKRLILLLALSWLAGHTLLEASLARAQQPHQAPGASANPTARQISLGLRLFGETRFSTPKGDLPASCVTCHLFDEDPQGLRAYTDFFNRSWFSHRTQDPRRLHARATRPCCST